MALISALLSRLLADEFKAWSPRIVQRLIECAVARLPEDQQERYAEEWPSHINEVPGEFGKLLSAVGFLFAARRMAAIEREQAEMGDIAKRMVDVTGSALLLLLQVPVFLLIVLVIRLTNEGATIVVERRVGLRGREFNMYKFGGAGRLERFLNRTRLAYLPQLINVLRGDMAFVGPDADMPHQAEVMSAVIPGWKERTLVKPGITGVAQILVTVVRQSSEPFNVELDFDLYYVKNRSFRLDILILGRALAGLLLRPPDL